MKPAKSNTGGKPYASNFVNVITITPNGWTKPEFLSYVAGMKLSFSGKTPFYCVKKRSTTSLFGLRICYIGKRSS